MNWLRKKTAALRAQYVFDKFISLAKGGDFLEVGCGNGAHTERLRKAAIFTSHTCIDLGDGHRSEDHIVGDFEQYDFGQRFDAIWTSHVLEHARNPGVFLDKLHATLKEGGLLALNVPPLRQRITTGHVSMWNPGLLLLQMVRAGFDCSEARIRQQGYNIGLILVKKTCPSSYGFGPDSPGSDRAYLPDGLKWFYKKSNGVWYFKGNFRSLNWE